MVLKRDKVEVAGALRLPLGGVNGYVGVRGKQGYKKNQFQGTTPRKNRRTKLCNTPREAAVALAELTTTQQPQQQDDPSRQLHFTSPVVDAPLARCGWAAGRRAIVPLRPPVEPRGCELPCVHSSMPMTPAQLCYNSAWRMCAACRLYSLSRACRMHRSCLRRPALRTPHDRS